MFDLSNHIAREKWTLSQLNSNMRELNARHENLFRELTEKQRSIQKLSQQMEDLFALSQQEINKAEVPISREVENRINSWNASVDELQQQKEDLLNQMHELEQQSRIIMSQSLERKIEIARSDGRLSAFCEMQAAGIG